MSCNVFSALRIIVVREYCVEVCLAIVHGLAYLKKHNMKQILYSDSVNAINWVRAKQCRTKLALTPDTEKLYDIIRRAEAWLHNNSYSTEIRKWDTDHWGEIPADFGRKG